MIRTLRPGQRCEVWIASVTGESQLVYTTDDVLLEAPNWTLDGSALILNGDGKLWSFHVATRTISQVPLSGIPYLNNDHVLAPDGHCDGPEYSPDSEWLHFNTEAFSDQPVHAQLARLHTSNGSTPEQLLESETVDWFPHLSPDGRLASYIRFPRGTVGHPADLPVDVVLVSTGDWTTPLYTWSHFGGQGTLNVNSWSPDSTRFAYVAYPLANTETTKD